MKKQCGALLAAAVMTTTLPLPAALAQEAAQATPDEQMRTFDIPAQPLSSAMTAFSRQSGLQVSANADFVRGVATPGVSGTLSPSRALAALLAGTGLSFRFTDSTTVTLERQGGAGAATGTVQLDPVRVQAEIGNQPPAYGPGQRFVATRSAAGTKTETPLLETPASISIITRKQIEEQGAQSVSEAVRTTPGVVTNWGGYDTRYDFMYVRGFAPTTFLNGLILPTGSTTATHGIPQIEPYGLERIEVLRGPASALYGQVPPGGILNLVSKRPIDTSFGEVQLQTGSYLRKQVAFDVGGPVTPDGSLLYRLTGLGRDADTQVNFVRDQRVFIAPSFTWRPTADTTFTFLSSYQKVNSRGVGFYPEVGTLFPSPGGRIQRSTFLGEPDFGGFDREFGTIGYAFQHKFSDAVTFNQNLQYAVSNTLNEGLAARGWVDSSQQLLRRDANSFMNNGKTFALDNQLTLKLDTGPINHTIIAGIDYQNFQNEFWYQVGTNAPNPINPYNPVYLGYAPVAWATRNHTNQYLKQFGVYVQDQLRFDRWLLTASGRHDSASLETFDHVTNATTNRVDNAFSWRVGLNYLIDGGWSPYVSYSTSFQPIVGTNYAGNPFEPSRATQIEAGLKYQPDGSPIFAALSIFDITRTNITTSDLHIGFQVQTGEARVRGLEFEFKARLMDTLDLTAAYAYSESEVTKSNDSTVYNGMVIPTLGKQLPFVPRHQASLWAYYTFGSSAFQGLSLGAGLRYVGALYGDNANVFETPATAFLDLAAAYDLGRFDHRLSGVQLRVNVSNVLDNYYVTCTGPAACYIGEGRFALATLNYRW